ncbi:MAG: [Bacteroidales bacterium]|nr:[FeFe] hydrogenase H-cluster maturation GTPase HydF [Bacteroidales bacterium]
MSKVRHIGIFGRRNAGKSSLINLLLGQDFAIVSDKAGTTTDPVKKRMEIPGVGPVQLIDTAGIDDIGEVGEKRVARSLKIVEEVDMAILLFTGNIFGKEEKDLLRQFKELDVPVVVVHNQSDIIPLDFGVAGDLTNMYGCDVVEFSCCITDPQEQQDAIDMLFAFITKGLLLGDAEKTIMHGLVEEGDNIVLVCPIDSEAPAGRMILPQVMAIRDILDNGGIATVLQPEQLKDYLKDFNPDTKSKKVKMVVTDSQVFKQVGGIVPQEIPLTSFSVLMARAKGPFEEYLKGVEAIGKLKDGDNVLVLESCTHHTSCEDIGRVKIPMMLQKKVGCKLNFTFVSGLDELPPLENFALVLQCGGCMVTHRQLRNRLRRVIAAGLPVTNYGMCIAYVTGIFERAVTTLV